MGLAINKDKKGTTGVESTQRLYFNADKTALVPEGDAEAAFLACGVGDEVPEGYDAPADADDSDEGWSALTVAQLTEYAKDNSIDLGGATRKDDIIAAIQEALGDDGS